MFDLNDLPLGSYLLNFASSLLNDQQRESLNQVIITLFNDLALGHSCSRLDDLALVINKSENALQQLMLDSGLAACYPQLPYTNNDSGKIRQVIPAKPIIIFCAKGKKLVYIAKYLAYELNVAAKVSNLSSFPIEAQNEQLASLQLNYFAKLSQEHNFPNFAQLKAIENSIKYKFSIITGGPGTGKTTTITLLLALLHGLYTTPLKFKICAPTGKAANRVKESIANSILEFKQKKISLDYSFFSTLLEDSTNFSTIHKLLGYRPQSIYFKHNEQMPLDVDILVVDESSMISLPLFSKLLLAINSVQFKHVILLGDKNQLSSVEEGYVFASLVDYYRSIQPSCIDLFSELSPSLLSELSVSKRNIGDVAKLAQAILNNNLLQVTELLNSSSVVSCHPLNLNHLLANLFIDSEYSLLRYVDFIKAADGEIDSYILFKQFQQLAVLCLTNQGYAGVENLNLQIEKRIRQLLMVHKEWYYGRPIIILENDYSLGLYNGDIGICIIRENKVLILFEDGREFIPEVLPYHQLAYALTIHKAQGSEYAHTIIVLPPFSNHKEKNTILSRELIYTAVTRAKSSVTIYASLNLLLQAISSKIERISGLSYMLV